MNIEYVIVCVVAHTLTVRLQATVFRDMDTHRERERESGEIERESVIANTYFRVYVIEIY